jgi:hypothetical protein
MFIQLTRAGGQSVLVNSDAVVMVRDRSGDQNPMIVMTNGVDFEVTEGYEDIMTKLAGA